MIHVLVSEASLATCDLKVSLSSSILMIDFGKEAQSLFRKLIGMKSDFHHTSGRRCEMDSSSILAQVLLLGSLHGIEKAQAQVGGLCGYVASHTSAAVMFCWKLAQKQQYVTV